MKSIDAAAFSQAILIAEGFGEASKYETTFTPQFETMFRDVFGDGEIQLDDDPPAP